MGGAVAVGLVVGGLGEISGGGEVVCIEGEPGEEVVDVGDFEGSKKEMGFYLTLHNMCYILCIGR